MTRCGPSDPDDDASVTRVFAEPARTAERLTTRTGQYRRRGSGGESLEDADHRRSNDDVRIVANRSAAS